jgi:hypothetical protein
VEGEDVVRPKGRRAVVVVVGGVDLGVVPTVKVVKRLERLDCRLYCSEGAAGLLVDGQSWMMGLLVHL